METAVQMDDDWGNIADGVFGAALAAASFLDQPEDDHKHNQYISHTESEDEKKKKELGYSEWTMRY